MIQKKLSEMTDKEINIAVFYFKNKIKHSESGVDLIDYCNSYEDTMPIAFKNGMTLRSIQPNKYAAECGLRSPDEAINENPLRAICEVYILINQ